MAQAEDVRRLKERLEGHPGPVLSVYLSVNARYPSSSLLRTGSSSGTGYR
jgi:hypothetical protein